MLSVLKLTEPGKVVVSPRFVWNTPLVTVRLFDSSQIALLSVPEVQGVAGVAVV